MAFPFTKGKLIGMAISVGISVVGSAIGGIINDKLQDVALKKMNIEKRPESFGDVIANAIDSKQA